MSNIINFQLSVFCNKRIEPTSEKITDLMKEIKSISQMDFLPNIINGQIIDMMAKQVIKVSNLSFATPDQTRQIIYMDDRIDFISNAVDEVFLEYEKELSLAEALLQFVLERDSIQGNRLALNLKMICENSFDGISPFAIKLCKPLDYYIDKPIEEWSNRCNTRETIRLGELDEVLNVVTSLSMTQNISTAQKYVLCHIDINTIAERNSFRFSSESIADFVAEVKPIADNIKSNFSEVSCYNE